MFKANYFSCLINKLCNFGRNQPSQSIRIHRHERASVACMLARIKANSTQSDRARELLNFALTRKVKEIVEKSLHKKYCCWLDLLRGNETLLQEPLASLLQPLNIFKIKDLTQLGNIPNNQLIQLLNKLNMELHKHEGKKQLKVGY